MTTVGARIICVVALLHALTITPCAADAAEGRIDIISIRPTVIGPDEKIYGIDLTFSSSSIDAVNGIPAAWGLTILNDVESGTKAEVKAVIYFGSAALDARALSKFAITLHEVPAEELILKAEGTVDVMRNFESSRTIKLVPADFVIKQLARPHKKTEKR